MKTEECYWRARSQNALEKHSFATSFMHLKLRRESKEDYSKLGDSKAEIGLQDS